MVAERDCGTEETQNDFMTFGSPSLYHIQYVEGHPTGSAGRGDS